MRWLDNAQAQEIATPTTPGAGFSYIYPKSDHLWYGLDSNGVERLLTSKAPTQQVLTVGSGTYTTPTGCIAIMVEVMASGGSGGGTSSSASNSAGGSGGGAGGYLRKLISAPAATYAYVVGAKGAATAAGANNGNTGANSTFGTSLLTAVAGGAGISMAFGTAVSVSRGGINTAISTGGDINGSGTAGEHGMRLSGAICCAGTGGATIWGSGGRGRDTASTGQDALGFGSGGGGATSVGAGDNAGGNGADGLIVVTEYY